MPSPAQRCFLLALWLISLGSLMSLASAFDVPCNPQRLSSLTQLSVVTLSTSEQQQQQKQQKQNRWYEEDVERNLAADLIEQAVLEGLDYKIIADLVEDYSRRFNIQYYENSRPFINNVQSNLSPNDMQQQQSLDVSPAFLSSSDNPADPHYYEDEEEARQVLDKAAQYIEEAFQRGIPYEQVRDMVDAYARVKKRLDQQKQETNAYRHQQSSDPPQPPQRLLFLPQPPTRPPPRNILLSALAEVATWNVDEANDKVTTTKAYRIRNNPLSSQQGVLDVAIEHKTLMP